MEVRPDLRQDIDALRWEINTAWKQASDHVDRESEERRKQNHEMCVCLESLRQDVKEGLEGQKQHVLHIVEREITERQSEDERIARALSLLQQALGTQTAENASRGEEIARNVQVMFKAMQQEKADLKTWMEEVSKNLEVAQAEMFREFQEGLQAQSNVIQRTARRESPRSDSRSFEADADEPSVITKLAADEYGHPRVDDATDVDNLGNSRTELLGLIEEVSHMSSAQVRPSGASPGDLQESIRRLQQGLEALVEQRLGSIVSLVDQRLEALVQEGRLHHAARQAVRSVSPSPAPSLAAAAFSAVRCPGRRTPPTSATPTMPPVAWGGTSPAPLGPASPVRLAVGAALSSERSPRHMRVSPSTSVVLPQAALSSPGLLGSTQRLPFPRSLASAASLPAPSLVNASVPSFVPGRSLRAPQQGSFSASSAPSGSGSRAATPRRTMVSSDFAVSQARGELAVPTVTTPRLVGPSSMASIGPFALM